MDINSMVNGPTAPWVNSVPQLSDAGSRSLHQHTSSSTSAAVTIESKPTSATDSVAVNGSNGLRSNASSTGSPGQSAYTKAVTFLMILPQSPDMVARNQLRLPVRPHDTTESLLSTIRNFFGLWDTAGSKVASISLEDSRGMTIIPRFENFETDMTVYVRAVIDGSPLGYAGSNGPQMSGSPLAGQGIVMQYQDLPQGFGQQSPTFPSGGSGFLPPPHLQGYSGSMPPLASASHTRPDLHISTNGHAKMVNGRLNQGADSNAAYSDSEDGPASTAGSRKDVVSAEISLENILDGGRRKRNRVFESSQLPLFAPSQVPFIPSYNSISPIRQGALTDGGRSILQPSPSTLHNMHSLQSPYSARGPGTLPLNQQQSPMMHYPLGSYGNGRRSGDHYSVSGGKAILPTPDMTVASHISDEDVAIQLMRLGDTSNISRSNRNSASTAEELNGHTDATSDAETDVESISQSHQRKRVKLEGADYDSHDEHRDANFGENGLHSQSSKAKPRARTMSAKSSGTNKKAKTPKSAPPKKSKIITLPTGFLSPSSMSAHSRKPSIASQLNMSLSNGEDLSSLPRCQRCRKSKKGCDRKRPCGRCKEAGIGPEGCVSEEEGNGRKGRYGRQMGIGSKAAAKKPMAPPPGLAQDLGQAVVQPHIQQETLAVPTLAASMNAESIIEPIPEDRKRKRDDEVEASQAPTAMAT